MAQYDERQLRKLLKAVQDPDLKPFLNKNALLRSEVFSCLVESGIKHLLEHGDSQKFMDATLPFSNTQHYKNLIDYACTRTGAKTKLASDGRLIISGVDLSNSDDSVRLKDWLDEPRQRGTKSQILQSFPPPKKRSKNARSLPDYDDKRDFLDMPYVHSGGGFGVGRGKKK